jgi:hypothetical protein
MHERNLNEGQWEDRKQWSLGVPQRRKTFRNGYTYIQLTLIEIVRYNNVSVSVCVEIKGDYFNCCLSVHVDNYTIIVPTKCTSFY